MDALYEVEERSILENAEMDQEEALAQMGGADGTILAEKSVDCPLSQFAL